MAKIKKTPKMSRMDEFGSKFVAENSKNSTVKPVPRIAGMPFKTGQPKGVKSNH